MKNIQPAIFLDRDGVINYDHNYVYQIEKFNFIPGTFDACRKFIERGYQLIIITNQAGIARGYYTESDFEKLNQWMVDQFESHGVLIKAVYYCPHHPEHGIGQYKKGCICRKPEPGMILQAVKEHDLDLKHSILIGDKLSDILAGKAAGIDKNYLVKTGKQITDNSAMQADEIYDDLLSLAHELCI